MNRRSLLKAIVGGLAGVPFVGKAKRTRDVTVNYETLGRTAKPLPYLLAVDDIARWYCIPAHLLSEVQHPH